MKLDTSVDYYSILGVKPSATADDIKRAYRQMVFRYHPDRNPDNSDAADKFNQVRDAYAVLSDALQRRAYDGINHPAGAEESEKSAEEKPDATAEQATNGNGYGSANSSFFKQEFKQQNRESEPKCPSCSVVGIEHIVSRKGGSSTSRGKQFVLSPFNVVLCDACGHVYGVTPTSS